MQHRTRRILAALLVMVLTFSAAPAAYAEEITDLPGTEGATTTEEQEDKETTTVTVSQEGTTLSEDSQSGDGNEGTTNSTDGSESGTPDQTTTDGEGSTSGTDADDADGTDGEQEEDTCTPPTVSYRARLYIKGWKSYVKQNGQAGTKGVRMTGLRINLNNPTKYSGSIKYRVRQQNYGWRSWVSNNKTAGVSGKYIYGLEIKLTGELAEHYRVMYRAYVRGYGWQSWVYDGVNAGITKPIKQIEAFQVKLVEKTSQAWNYSAVHTSADLTYAACVGTYGQLDTVKSGAIAGTVGENKRMEGFTIYLNQAKAGLPEGTIQYRAFLNETQTWTDWVSAGKFCGVMYSATGTVRRVGAIQVRLTGELAECYNLYIQAYTQGFGWLDWTKATTVSACEDPDNMEGVVGTFDYGYRLEAFRLQLLPSDEAFSESTNTPYKIKPEQPFTDEIIAAVKKYVGKKYVSGGETPSGWDCSGFTRYVYKTYFGITLYHQSSVQATYGVAVNKSKMADWMPGDLIFWSSKYSTSISHVSLYLGDGIMIHAANSKSGTILSDVTTYAKYMKLVSVRRIL